jgi:hypothetical protein
MSICPKDNIILKFVFHSYQGHIIDAEKVTAITYQIKSYLTCPLKKLQQLHHSRFFRPQKCNGFLFLKAGSFLFLSYKQITEGFVCNNRC